MLSIRLREASSQWSVNVTHDWNEKVRSQLAEELLECCHSCCGSIFALPVCVQGYHGVHNHNHPPVTNASK